MRSGGLTPQPYQMYKPEIVDGLNGLEARLHRVGLFDPEGNAPPTNIACFLETLPMSVRATIRPCTDSIGLAGVPLVQRR